MKSGVGDQGRGLELVGQATRALAVHNLACSEESEAHR